MKQIDDMIKMTEITDIRDIPSSQGEKNWGDLGIMRKPKILHRGHIKRKLDGIFTTPLFFVVSDMGSGKTTAVREFLRKKRKIK